MQRDLYVFIRTSNGHRVVTGRVLYEKMADGNIQSYFRYEPSWLSRVDAFALDPIHLPLTTDIFQLKTRTGLWGVFEDALPDAWGRRLLTHRHHIDVSRSNNIDLLLLTGWAEPGATGFAASNKIPPHNVEPMDLALTDQAITLSETFEKNDGVVTLPDFFISGGSSAGGARPKVLAQSGKDLFIVKFPSITDPAPDVMANLEFFGLRCVQLAGLEVPDFFPVHTSSSHVALAVQRFDTMEPEGRRHFLSFQSLIGVEEQLGLPYATMAEILKKVSVEPEADICNLYVQMVINVLINNCDDHLKNFAMIHSPILAGYCLSPAYDVVPNLWQQEHILSIAGQTKNVSYNDVLAAGDQFSISPAKTRKLLLKAVEAVRLALQESEELFQQLTTTHLLCAQLLTTIQDTLDTFTTAISGDTP